MARVKSEGIRRLSIAVGLVAALVVLLGIPVLVEGTLALGAEVWLLLLGLCVFVGVLGWGLVQLVGWVISGFQKDT